MKCNALHTYINFSFFGRTMWCSTIMCSTLNEGKLMCRSPFIWDNRVVVG